jgi:hypothetical protein
LLEGIINSGAVIKKYIKYKKFWEELFAYFPFTT